jgi:hypothetical protein
LIIKKSFLFLFRDRMLITHQAENLCGITFKV